MDTLKFDLISPTASIWRAQRKGNTRGPRVFRFSMLPSLAVAAAMPDGVETRIIDENVEPVDFDTDADLIGISFMTFNAPRAYEIAGQFRDRGKTVIFGGFHPTFLPYEAIAHCDAVCVGEAEYNAPRMIADFRAGRLQPIYRSERVDLADLPRPPRDLLQPKRYLTPNVLQATRGCPYKCKFCSIAAFHGYQIRTRPVEAVIDELKGMGRQVVFMDDNIIGDRDYALGLFEAMVPLGKKWFSQCGIHMADDDELLRAAVRSGCGGLFVGLESLSQENLSRWTKGPNRAAEYVRQVRTLHDKGIAVYAGFVFGSDGDSPEVFQRTLEFLDEARIDALQATRLTPFPGTPLFEEMDQAGRIFDKDWSHYDFGHVVFEPLHMSRETLDLGVAWISREFYSRRRVARRLVGELSYLAPSSIIRGSVPLNLGYRVRFGRNGTLEKGARFDASYGAGSPPIGRKST
ncbi:MAG: B12-binding domain-containing radical SAM protein [Gemmatimonadetes bacterium]|nr:B12-binding domain-containing radical SAM protein [Gemmatimonadota bacterium]